MKLLPNGIAVLEGDTHASKWIEEQGKLFYDPTIQDVIMPLLNTGDVCVDAGAMLGAYAAGMKQAVGPTGRVIAFEPNTEAMACLVHNCPDVECKQFALGAVPGLADIVRDQNAGATYVKTGGSDVVVAILDDYDLPRLDFLKIDVEGMEPDVLVGAARTLVRCRPIIFTEINHGALARAGHTYVDILAPLIRLGYSYQFIDEAHNFRAADWPQIDMLFVP